MNDLRNPSTSIRRRPELHPALLVIATLGLLGGATGSLISPADAVINAAIGLVGGVVLTLTATWLSHAQPHRRVWATAFLLALFLAVGLLAGSSHPDPTTGAVIGGMIMASGVLLTAGATWLSRTQPPGQAWAQATLILTVLALGLFSGSGLVAQLLFDTALVDAQELLPELIRGPIGAAEALPFYLLNPPLELLLIPLAVLLTWPVPRQRWLLLCALVVFVSNRLWAYLYFVPQTGGWIEGGAAPLTPEQLDQATLFVDLSWIRLAIDITTTLLVLLAATARPDAPARSSEAPIARDKLVLRG